MQKRLTISEARQKIYRYCAYQERAHQEVRDKLYAYGLRRDEVEELLTHLITEGFLNEERFAKAFAGGKFRLKKWGRLKIVRELELRGLTANCIRAGLKEIDGAEYRATLTTLVDKKSTQVEVPNEFLKRERVANFAIQKGFEPELVWEVVKERV